METKILPKTNWIYDAPNTSLVKRLSQSLNLPEFISAILIQRGFTDPQTAHDFLNPSLDNLHDPFLLNDMERAVNRICQALRNQEKILICGDYDVDGITSVALLKICLPVLGADVEVYLPNRLSDGYGFHNQTIEHASSLNAKLIITVDCGISSREAVDSANALGIDVIITDHHEPNGPIPDAYAVINPKREDSTYPDSNLAGIGVAFKMIQALIAKGILNFPLPPLLELVALGTVADVAQLSGENRILVHFGLEALAHTSHPGLKALMKVAHVIHGRRLDPMVIGFQLGPRINAVGRLGTPEEALNLLMSKSHSEAELLAKQMNSLNHQRQMIEEDILKSAEQQIQLGDLSKKPFIVVSGENWHEGVIGIVASKISERYYKPACVISIKEGIGKGSGRSIPSFSLFDCLSQIKDLLIEFGGHQIAAGFRIKPENIPEFANLCTEITENVLTQDDFIPKTSVDYEVTLSELSFRAVKSLERLSPFGLGNPKPRFLIRNVHLRYSPRQVGSDGSHVKLVLSNGSKSLHAIAFNFGDAVQQIQSAPRLDVIATPEINEWNGRIMVQLNIHDIYPYSD
ncbi:single-stranded-DNA-specific exonuclease RecJ [bacterium]|nr:single-stranded-DNA-specific exonuclease RecJ [candidate division CSSED10-310 bacterium]